MPWRCRAAAAYLTPPQVDPAPAAVLAPTREEQTAETLVPSGDAWVHRALERDPKTSVEMPLLQYVTDLHLPPVRPATGSTIMGPTALASKDRTAVGVGPALAPPTASRATAAGRKRGKNKAPAADLLSVL